MGLRIRTNVSSIRAQRHLYDTRKENSLSMERLSSGYRINKAADDAAGLAISEKLRAKIRSAEQAKRNTADGISMVQVTEGAYNEITSVLIRLRELAVQASSDTISNLERGYANKEYVQLVDEIERIGNSTEYNGIRLLQGPEKNNDMDELGIHVGIGDASIPNVDDIKLSLETMKVDINSNIELGREDEIGPIEEGEDFTRVQANEKISKIDRHLTLVANNRAYLGSKQNRLNSTISNLGVQIENMQSTKSRIKDIDFASETANFTQTQILSNSGASVLSQANSAPELVMALLR